MCRDEGGANHDGLLQDAHVEHLNLDVQQWLAALEEREKL